MVCPRCGAELPAASTRCPRCVGLLDARNVATGVLTPPPVFADAPTLLPTDSPHFPAAAGPIRNERSDALTLMSSASPTPADRDASKRIVHPTDASTPGAPASAAAATGPLAVGQSFGSRYHILRELGVGGMGAVYQAWDAELGVAVAIKVIRPEVMADPTAAAEIERRFKRELLLARQVTHKNVVRIHDLGDIDGMKYITMPYVEGDDLATVLIREGRLPVERVLRIARSVVSGLVAAHKAGVVHRDLKPANIMVDAEDDAMIMDFGIARSTGIPSGRNVPGASTIIRNLKAPAADRDATLFGTVVGTVEYMAPEQATGIHVDQRADIYAFGLILYDLLAGRSRLGVGPSITELKARMEQAPPPVRTLVPEVPEEVNQLIARCLEPDPAKRFQTSEELAAALATLDDEGKPIPVPARFSKKLIAAVATAVLAAVTGTWYFTRTPPPVRPHDPVTVLIADFANNTNDPTFDHTLEPMLRLGLEGAGFIDASDHSRVRSTFGVAPPEKFDEAAARQVAMKEGVGILLSGSIGPSDGGYEISVKATQPISGNVTATAKARAETKDQILATVAKLTATIRKALGEKTSEADQLFAMRSISGASLDTIRQYSAGIELSSKGRDDEAIPKFRKAVQIDPTFGLGYVALAVSLKNVGKAEESSKYAQEALRHLDGMTEHERLFTRGNYYRLTGDLQQCIKEYGELTARYPADTVAHSNRAFCLAGLRDYRGAIDETRQALQILPHHMIYRENLAMLLDYAGDFASAEREAKSIPNPTAQALQGLPLSLLGQGRLEEATAAYQKMATMGAFGAAFAASGLGDLAVYEGRFSDAAGIYKRGAEADVKAGNPDFAAQKLAALAHAQLLRGQSGAAIAAADQALSNSQALSVKFLTARILVEAGAVAKAQAIADSLASALASAPQAYGKIIQGEIALKQHHLPEAVKILTDANAIVDTWVGHLDLGRAYLEGGAFAEADSQFDRCIRRRGEALLLVDEDPTYGYFPPVYYYAGRAREGLQTAGYADMYREYLKIRGRSTEDPFAHDARRRAGQ